MKKNLFLVLAFALNSGWLKSASPATDATKALMWAIANGNLNEAKRAVAQGADVNYQANTKMYDQGSNTPLMLAAQNHDINMVTFLINTGKVNYTIKNGWNDDAVTSALYTGCPECQKAIQKACGYGPYNNRARNNEEEKNKTSFLKKKHH